MNSSKLWNLLYTVLSIVALLCLMLPLYALFLPQFCISLIPCIVMMTLLFLFGFGSGKLLRFRKKKSVADFSYAGENTEKPGLRNCALPGLLCLLCTGFLMIPVKRYILTLPNYLDHSFIPVEAFLLMGGAMLCGVITSVRPYYQIVGFRSILSHFAIFLIYGFFLLYMRQSTTVLLFSFLVWLLCAAILFNQTYIVKSILQAQVGEARSRNRLYNFAILFALLLVGIAITLVVALIINGLYFLVKTLLFILLTAFFNRQAELEGNTPDEAIFDGGLYSGGLFEDITANQSSVYFFLLLFLALVLFLTVGKGLHLRDRLRNLLGKIMNALLALFAMRPHGLSQRRRKKSAPLIEDYQDEEKKQDRNAVFDTPPSQKRSYRGFLRQLNGIKGEGEKLAFAYSGLIGCFREMQIGLLPGDTPREILAKISEKLTVKEAETITAAYELVRYGEREDLPEIRQILQKILLLYRKYADE